MGLLNFYNTLIPIFFAILGYNVFQENIKKIFGEKMKLPQKKVQ